MKTGFEIECKVRLVSLSTITYKLKSNPDGPDHEIGKDKVLMIRYANGSKDIFTDTEQPEEESYVPDTPELSASDKCHLGTMDADMYHGWKGASVTSGVCCGVFGVLACAIGSPTPEKGKQTSMMSGNKDLFSDPNYRKCYEKKARGTKINHALIGWAAWLLLLVVAAAAG